MADIGLVGLGVMGSNLALNMAEKGYTVAVHNRTTSKIDTFMQNAGPLASRLVPCKTVEELAAAITPPRPVVIMVKAGVAVDAVIDGAFAPFQISIPSDALGEALAQFSSDLGAPRAWAEVAIAAIKDTQPPRITIAPGDIDDMLRRLHAVAVAKMRLRPATPVTEITYLTRMRADLEHDLTVHSMVDDPRTAPAREIKGKIKAISGMLKQLEREARR